MNFIVQSTTQLPIEDKGETKNPIFFADVIHIWKPSTITIGTCYKQKTPARSVVAGEVKGNYNI